MRLSSRMFTVTVLAMTGLAVFVLYGGYKQDDQLKQSSIPGFRTVGENRVLNVFRRNKIRIGGIKSR